MDDLAAFLNARLDEAEAVARRNVGVAGLSDSEEFGPSYPDYQTYDSEDINAACDYLNTFRPLRMLREIEAKRAIVAAHHPETPSKYGLDVLRCAVCQTERGVWAEDRHADPWPCQTLCALASAWSDHPDYRQEWTL
jgi:hypothetical protein